MAKGLSSRATRRFLDERFRAAVSAPNDRAALEPLREHAVLMSEYLMSPEARAMLAELEPDIDLDWLHDIYDAISEVAEERREATEESQDPGRSLGKASFSLPSRPVGLSEAPSSWIAMARPRKHYEFNDPPEAIHPSDREDALVGQAFEESLVGGLRPELVDVERFFAETEPVDARLETAYQATPSVAAAGPVARRLARYGITPVLVVNACQAVATAARRHYRTYGLPRERAVVIDYRSVGNDPASVTVLHRAPLCAGVQLATELAPAVSERLFTWLMRVASCKPLLLDGFQAREIETGVLLKPTAERVDLFTAWGTNTPSPRQGRSR